MLAAFPPAVRSNDAVAAGTEHIDLAGTFECGTSRYDVTGHVILCMGSISNLALVIGQESEPVARLEVRTSGDGDSSLALSGKAYPIGSERLAAWASFFHLTWGGLETNSMFEAGDAEGDLRVLESRSPEQFGEGLPVRTRFLFRKAGSGPGVREDAKPVGVTVYSLAEWNNRFNDTVVLRLRLDRKEAHSER